VRLEFPVSIGVLEDTDDVFSLVAVWRRQRDLVETGEELFILFDDLLSRR
jgi:hypothetical protein